MEKFINYANFPERPFLFLSSILKQFLKADITQINGFPKATGVEFSANFFIKFPKGFRNL